jgi:general secretion pathway protein D
MRYFRSLAPLIGLAALLSPLSPWLEGRTRKGDRLLAQGKAAETRKEWDRALELYEQALSEDPADPAYQLGTDRVRFQAGQFHIDQGQKLRMQGQLAGALAEFEKAYAIDASSSMAEQEIRRTRQMIEREKKKARQPGAKPEEPEEKGMTPAQVVKRQVEEKISTMLDIPELKPLNPQAINLKMNNQPPKVLFETVGKLAGINVLFDPEYQAPKNQSIEFNGSTLEEALDYLAMVTKSFWKPLSANTIFVANDNTTKRRDYEEQVTKVFYLTNITKAQDLQEIVTAVRSVADIQRIFVYNAQNAIIIRAEADRIALAEKIIHDLDKPIPEVVIDVLVMEVNKAKTRDLAAAVAPNGINSPIVFTPRAELGGRTVQQQQQNQQQNPGLTGQNQATGPGPIPITNLGRINAHDFSITVPGGLVQALMNDRSSRVLQSPQVRALDSQKATLKIGDKVPYATGSFQPGIGGVGINPLVNTQFTFLDVGVNVDITPKIHGADEVSLHVEVEISQVRDRINLGGIDQPVVGQRKVVHDIRMKEGEVNLLGGLMQQQETKTVTGVPGLSSIPILKRLFTSETTEKNESELLIALIPHIVRVPEITEENLKAIAVGNATVVKLNYAPRKPATPEAAPAPAPATMVPKPAVQPPVTAPPKPTPPAPEPSATKPQVPAPAAPATGSTRVVFAPARLETQLSSAVTVTLMVENASDLFSAPLNIKFDPKVLRLNDIVRGNLLASDGQQVVFTKNILNDTGDATVNLNRFAGTGGITGSGNLVTLSFQAVGKGTTTVSIPQLTLRNTKSQPILTTTPQLTVNVK